MDKNFYSAEEKIILWNYFILHSPGSKSAYRELLNNLAWKLNAKGMNAHLPDGVIPSIHLKFDTSHLLWDEHDNVVTKLVAQPEFFLNEKNFKKLDKIHPQWNYINAKKEHVGFMLTRHLNAVQAWKLIEEHALDPNQTNDEGHYCTYYLINFQAYIPAKIEKKNAQFFRALNENLKYTVLFFEKYPHQLSMTSEDHQIFWQNWSKMKKNMLDCWQYTHPDMKKEVRINFDSLIAKLDKIFFYPYLNQLLNNEDDSSSQTEVKTVKI